MSNNTRIYNKDLKVDSVISGDIQILDSTTSNMLSIGLLDTTNIPSINLLRIVDLMNDQLGITWKNDPKQWDTLHRNLGGGIFISIPWEIVE